MGDIAVWNGPTATWYVRLSSYDSGGSPVAVSAIGNPYQFGSRRVDEESGLMHHRNRAYHAPLGRFLQRDPAGFVDGLNLYAYALNNPLLYRDPYGLSAEELDIADIIFNQTAAKAAHRRAQRLEQRKINDYIAEHQEDVDAMVAHYDCHGLTPQGAARWMMANDGSTELPKLGSSSKGNWIRQGWLVDYWQTGAIDPQMQAEMDDMGITEPGVYFGKKAEKTAEKLAEKHWFGNMCEGFLEAFDPVRAVDRFLKDATWKNFFQTAGQMFSGVGGWQIAFAANMDGADLTVEGWQAALADSFLTPDQQMGFAQFWSAGPARVIRYEPVIWTMSQIDWLKPYIGTVVTMPLQFTPLAPVAPFVAEGIQCAVDDRPYDFRGAMSNFTMQMGMQWGGQYLQADWFNAGTATTGWRAAGNYTVNGAISGGTASALGGGNLEDVLNGTAAGAAGGLAGGYAGAYMGHDVGNRIVNPAVQSGAASLLRGEDPWEAMAVQVGLGLYRAGLYDVMKNDGQGIRHVSEKLAVLFRSTAWKENLAGYAGKGGANAPVAPTAGSVSPRTQTIGSEGPPAADQDFSFASTTESPPAGPAPESGTLADGVPAWAGARTSAQAQGARGVDRLFITDELDGLARMWFWEELPPDNSGPSLCPWDALRERGGNLTLDMWGPPRTRHGSNFTRPDDPLEARLLELDRQLWILESVNEAIGYSSNCWDGTRQITQAYVWGGPGVAGGLLAAIAKAPSHAVGVGLAPATAASVVNSAREFSSSAIMVFDQPWNSLSNTWGVFEPHINDSVQEFSTTLDNLELLVPNRDAIQQAIQATTQEISQISEQFKLQHATNALGVAR